MGQVGQRQRDLAQLRLDRLQPRLVGLQPVAQIRNRRQQGRHVLPCRLGLADRLGAGVAGVLQLLHIHLQGLALRLQGLDAGGVELHPAAGELLGDHREIGAQQAWV